jgi:aspartyl/asparaginyl beta-hydroxylase (cupin superfamily)
MFHDTQEYSFAAVLESHWRAIQAEVANIPPGGYTAWPEKFLYEQGWDVFVLYGFGRRLARNCELCPVTTRVVEQVPGMVTAGFSVLAPGTHIRPHVGYTTQVLRCHLGVVVPDADCMLRVGSETRSWREGECLIFDDTVEHEAWNRSSAPRTVLLLDFTRPGVTYRPTASPEATRITATRGTRRHERSR